MTVALYSSEMSVTFYQTTLRHTSQDSNLHSHPPSEYEISHIIKAFSYRKWDIWIASIRNEIRTQDQVSGSQS
jgi:hypothetical protein